MRVCVSIARDDIQNGTRLLKMLARSAVLQTHSDEIVEGFRDGSLIIKLCSKFTRTFPRRRRFGFAESGRDDLAASDRCGRLFDDGFFGFFVANGVPNSSSGSWQPAMRNRAVLTFRATAAFDSAALAANM